MTAAAPDGRVPTAGQGSRGGAVPASRPSLPSPPPGSPRGLRGMRLRQGPRPPSSSASTSSSSANWLWKSSWAPASWNSGSPMALTPGRSATLSEPPAPQSRAVPAPCVPAPPIPGRRARRRSPLANGESGAEAGLRAQAGRGRASAAAPDARHWPTGPPVRGVGAAWAGLRAPAGPCEARLQGRRVARRGDRVLEPGPGSGLARPGRRGQGAGGSRSGRGRGRPWRAACGHQTRGQGFGEGAGDPLTWLT